MQKINIQRIIYHIRHRYWTVNNIVIVVAFVIAASWVWGSLSAMQRNYNLQKQVDYKKQQMQLIQLETANLRLQQNYYKTAEYQELALRELGLARPGEHQLILPANSPQAVEASKTTIAAVKQPADTNNFEQWVNFLFGGYSRSISSRD